MNAYLLNTETMQWPIYEGDYKAMYPNVSFSNPLVPFPPCVWVQDTTQPSYNWITEGVREITPTEVDSEWVRTWEVYSLPADEVAKNQEIAKQNNKTQASGLLSATDWVELGDVANPSNPPYLVNKSEFTTYRAQLRAIAVNPPVLVEVWPTKPVEVWAS